MEIWKDIKDYENYYEVSNLGNIRSKNHYSVLGQKRFYKSKEIKTIIDNGYFRVSLYIGTKKNTLRLHRIIAIAFINNIENKPQVNHINGIKTDNRVENLEWCTSSENVTHAYKNNLIKTKLSKKDVIDIFNDNNSQRLIAKKYNVSQGIISRIKNKKVYKYLHYDIVN